MTGDRNHGVEILDFPNLGGVVGATGREMLDIRREENASDVFVVGLEVSDWHKLSLLTILKEVPNVNIAL